MRLHPRDSAVSDTLYSEEIKTRCIGIVQFMRRGQRHSFLKIEQHFQRPATGRRAHQTLYDPLCIFGSRSLIGHEINESASFRNVQARVYRL
jgi:hypothetical protein